MQDERYIQPRYAMTSPAWFRGQGLGEMEAPVHINPNCSELFCGDLHHVYRILAL